MAVPVASAEIGYTDNDSAGVTVSKPAGVATGDQLFLVAWNFNDNRTYSAPSGWTAEVNDTITYGSLFVASRVADGTEGASITINSSGNSFHFGYYFAVSGAGPFVISAISNGPSNGTDIPGGTAAANETLQIGLAANRESTRNYDGDEWTNLLLLTPDDLAGTNGATVVQSRGVSAGTVTTDNFGHASFTTNDIGFSILLEPDAGGGGGTTETGDVAVTAPAGGMSSSATRSSGGAASSSAAGADISAVGARLASAGPLDLAGADGAAAGAGTRKSNGQAVLTGEAGQLEADGNRITAGVANGTVALTARAATATAEGVRRSAGEVGLAPASASAALAGMRSSSAMGALIAGSPYLEATGTRVTQGVATASVAIVGPGSFVSFDGLRAAMGSAGLLAQPASTASTGHRSSGGSVVVIGPAGYITASSTPMQAGVVAVAYRDATWRETTRSATWYDITASAVWRQ